jgi:putative transposase
MSQSPPRFLTVHGDFRQKSPTFVTMKYQDSQSKATSQAGRAIMATRRPKTIHFWRGDLPHWQVEDGRYFVTIHLHGALPNFARDKIREISTALQCTDRENDDSLKLSRRIFVAMERWLDQSLDASHFERPELCEMVAEAIEVRCQRRIWDMFSYVIMPSHLHLFFELDNQLSLKHELQAFKRWTGHQACRMFDDLAEKQFWQTEWFDHWSRSDEGDEKIIRYIQNNPVKAKLASRVGEYSYCK